jgi:predicted short-subunit dehydrogenase-like oxidoreductase (DUF2520 family)
MQTLSCIGAGLLGKTLCHLLSNQLSIQQVINRSMQSSQLAVDFIGAGRAAAVEDIQPADIWLIATPDDAIGEAGQTLLQSGALKPGTIVFHCSGALGAEALGFADPQVYRASLHPIHSFANPSQSLTSFAGTHCAVEGAPQAIEVLTPLFSAIGALPFTIESQRKVLYHASTVMACNYLVSLLETSQQLLSASGVDSSKANPLEPLIRQTLDNFFATNARSALTGPIARGDNNTVARHLAALDAEPDHQLWQQIYRSLGRAAVAISAEQGQASTESLEAIAQSLKPSAGDN